jgi:hypothetical protein
MRARAETAAQASHLVGGGRVTQAPLRDAPERFPVNLEVPPRDYLGMKALPRALPKVAAQKTFDNNYEPRWCPARQK